MFWSSSSPGPNWLEYNQFEGHRKLSERGRDPTECWLWRGHPKTWCVSHQVSVGSLSECWQKKKICTQKQTMVSMRSCVGSHPWDIISPSLVTALLLSRINCMRKMRGMRRRDGRITSWVPHTQQFLAVLTIWNNPDLCIIFGKQEFFSTQSPAAFWLADVRMEAILEPTIFIMQDHSHMSPLATGFGLESWMRAWKEDFLGKVLDEQT